MAASNADAGDGGPALRPGELWRRIGDVYEQAQQSGAALKTDTRTELWDEPRPPGMQFVLRVTPALKAKPKGPQQQQKQQQQQQQQSPQPDRPQQQQHQQPRPGTWVNPFLPYEEALWVAHLSPTHTLLLNKFNVVAKHVLVVTRVFEPQTDPLNAADLAATLQVLRAMPQGGLAFYNCGEHSGRSQPHKHLQVVPLPFDDAQPPQPPLTAALDAVGAQPLEPFELRSLPFRAHAGRLPEAPTGDEAAALFSRLFSACKAGLPEPVSYNAVIWREAMVVVPRSRESAGPCAINALGFAGTMLLRSTADVAYVKSAGPMAMLADVGVPWD